MTQGEKAKDGEAARREGFSLSAARLRLWTRIAKRHPSAFLLLAQLLSLLTYPLMDESPRGRVLFGAVALVVVPLAVWVVRRSSFFNIVAWMLAIPAMMLTVVGVVFDTPALLPLSAILESTLYFYAAGSLIVYMLNDHEVTPDELFATGATFTLLAWGFAYAYYACQTWYPGSFLGAIDPERPRRWLELLFLSFSTLAGVGVGDVLPVSAPARVLNMFEMLVGVGYLAMVVSRLMSLTVAKRDRSKGG